MKSILRLLIVEDSEDDALLLLRALRREGYAPDYQRVDNREQIELALQNQKWDLIITDHILPMLSSGDVIAMVKQAKINTPVIIVSGYITDEKAVAAMKSGAQDYIMKDNLSRLVPAIERELNDARSRDARMRAEDALRFIAHHDTLTSLVNRSELERRLLSAIESAKLFNYPHVFLYIDLDQFKVINDTSGHIAGDEMIKQLAHRLKSMMRESDTLARIGGDEFGILLENCGVTAATKISEELLQAIHDYRFEWQGKPYRVTASIGFVAIDKECKNIESVLSSADVACYTAKDQGGNRIKVYHQDDQLMAKRYGEMQWVSTINQALECDRFCLFKQIIQPLYPVEPVNVHQANYRQNLSSRSFSRLNEFLLRLKDPGLDETLSPDDFIPAAERYNLMPKIDRWVVRHAFEYISGEISNGDHNEDDLYFINLSGATLSDASFYQFLQKQ